jgi:hypothetical protein
MTHTDNVLSFRPAAPRPVLDTRTRSLVEGCRRVVERGLPKLTAGLFEQLDDTLYELAGRAGTDQLQTAYFDAMRTVRRQRQAMETRFVDGVLEDYDRFWEWGPRSLAPRSAPAGAGGGLALVEPGELEESLTLADLVAKGENSFRRELQGLGQRFAVLLGGQDVEFASLPLGPAGLCHRFQHASRVLDLDARVRLVLYKQFDRSLMHPAGGLYEELNALLGHAGIRPPPAAPGRVVVTAPARPAAAGSRAGAPAPGQAQDSGGSGAERGPGPGSAEPAATPGEVARTALEVFRALQSVLTEYRASRGIALPESAATVARPELLTTLSQLQQDAAGPGAGPDLRRQLSDRLQLGAADAPRRSLEPADGDTLDVVALLFEFLLGDPALPDPIKVLIARLQIPLVRVALLDKSFFSRKLHPARRLLNNLARAAVGWNAGDDPSSQALYARIESVVSRVLAGYGDDPALFGQLNEEFEGFLEKDRRLAEIAEARTRQVVRGKEQLRVAKAAVAGELEARLRSVPHLPPVVRELLENGWRDVLLLTFLRQGPDSGAWRESLALADQLLWSVQPKQDQTERQALLRGIPDLLRRLREGLTGISYDQHEVARLFKGLQTCHVACLRGGVAEGCPGRQGLAGGIPGGPGPDVAPAAGSEAHDRFFRCAEALPMGAWLEFRDEAGDHSRVRLSWKSDVSDAMVFVNRRGAKVLEMTTAGVARALRDGVARTLGDIDVPILDRALERLLEHRRRDGAGQD